VRTFWLSFTDETRQEGSQFLGVCVIDVTDADVELVRQRLERTHPYHAPGAEWLAAAIRKAWRLGINPGGAVAGFDITPADDITVPRNELLSEDILKKYERIP
jgi:hypothetical protein